VCPAGFYCPLRTGAPIPCSDGFYMNTTRASSCTICPAGYVCQAIRSTSTYFDCPIGYYCPVGTGTNPIACPVGRYGSRINLMALDDCLACPPSMFCSQTALTAPNGNCTAGYFCPQGSMNQFGMTAIASSNICPIGYYCPPSSNTPLPCTPGTYNPILV
jgi:hypothetical protein